MNFEDKIREEYEISAQEDGPEYDSKHTIEEWTGFIESHLKDAKDADADNDPGAVCNALAKAGGLVLLALRTHGRKWHYGESPSEREEAKTSLERTKRKLAAAERELAAIREVHLKYGEEIGNTPVIEDLGLDGVELAGNVCHEMTNIIDVWAGDFEAMKKRAEEAEGKIAEIRGALTQAGLLRRADLSEIVTNLAWEFQRHHSLLIALLPPFAAYVPEWEPGAKAEEIKSYWKQEGARSLDAKPKPTIEQRLEQLANLELEVANAYATRATDDFAEVEARCWDLQKAKGHYRRREQFLKEWGEEADR